MDFGKTLLRGFEKLINNRAVSETEKQPVHNGQQAAGESVKDQPVDIKFTAQIMSNTNEPPDFQGDFAKALFLWSLKKAAPISNDTYYNSYLLWEGGIRNCLAYHKQLYAEGYFKPAEFRDLADNLKVAELKEILVGFGLPKSGKKADLVDRLVANSTIEVLKTYYPEPTFVLSPLGEEFLETHEGYIEIHRNYLGFGYQEYDKVRKDGERYEETAIRILEQHIAAVTSNYGRNEYYWLYQAYAKLGRDTEALKSLLRVLYIDLSGACEQSMFDLYYQGAYSKKQLLEYADVALLIAPAVLTGLRSYDKLYNENMTDELYRWKLPIKICSKETFRQIVHYVLDGTGDENQIRKVLKWDYLAYLTGIHRKKRR